MSGFDLAAQLPALQVVLPLFAAPIAFILRRGIFAWAFSTIVAWAKEADHKQIAATWIGRKATRRR